MFLTPAVQILRCVEENAFDMFKGHDRKNVEIVRDIAGIRPAREGRVYIEKEVSDRQNVVHAYGKSYRVLSTVGRYIANMDRNWWWQLCLQLWPCEVCWDSC